MAKVYIVNSVTRDMQRAPLEAALKTVIEGEPDQYEVKVDVRDGIFEIGEDSLLYSFKTPTKKYGRIIHSAAFNWMAAYSGDDDPFGVQDYAGSLNRIERLSERAKMDKTKWITIWPYNNR